MKKNIKFSIQYKFGDIMSDFQNTLRKPIQGEIKQEEDPTVLASDVKKVKLEEQPEIMQEQITKQHLFASLQQFLSGFGITDILQFVEDSIGQFKNTKHQVIEKKEVSKLKIYDKGKKVLARLNKHQTNKYYEANNNFHLVFNQIRSEFSKQVMVGQSNGIIAQDELYRQFLTFSNKIRIRTFEYQNITSNHIRDFILLLCKFHIYSINKNIFEHYYQDLLILLAQEKLQKPISLCLQYLNGDKSFQQIQATNVMSEKEWKELQVTLKKYYEIGRFYYKSHCCDYYNYIVENKLQEKGCYKEWFSQKSLTEQCAAGKKQFKKMHDEIINSEDKDLQVHMQNFTTFDHYKQLLKRQNKKDFQLSQYMDDIYNCMILYPFVEVDNIELENIAT
ncbi:hypothetical protein pb186bvf_002725 [Paramecium bursaria]